MAPRRYPGSIASANSRFRRKSKFNCIETRKKGHTWEAKNDDNNAAAISKYAVELGHSTGWNNYKILQIETDYHKRKFIESFYINSLSNVFNDKRSVVFHVYTKICFRNLISLIF